MLKLLLKYKIAKIVPMQESFFYLSFLPKKVKLSKEIIYLNYEKFSPILNPFIITYIDKKMLYIWFTKSDYADDLFVIPEAFLLYDILKNQKDGVYIFDTTPKRILVLKDSQLKAAFTITQNDDISLEVLKDEYQIDSCFNLSSKSFKQNYSQAIKNIKLSELYKFLQFDLNKNDLKKFIINKLSYPVISLLVVYMVISYAQSYFMKQRIENLTEKYHNLKNKNTKIKQAIRKYNADVRRYEKFVKTELQYTDPFKIIYDMYHIIKKEDKTTIIYLDISNDIAKLRISTRDDPIKYLNRLNKIKYFKNVVLQNTYKKRDGQKIISYFIELKEI